MQEEENKNRKLGLSQGGHGPLTQVKITVTVIKGRKTDNWPLYYCLIWCCLIQFQLYNDHPFQNEIDVLNYVFFCSTNYSNKEEHLRKH